MKTATPTKKRRFRGIEKAFKGDSTLSSVYWPWLMFFAFFNYFIHSIRHVIATTPGGAITGMVAWGIFAIGIPLWAFCVWRCAPNTERPVWMYLSRVSLILIAYYTYKRLWFLALIVRS